MLGIDITTLGMDTTAIIVLTSLVAAFLLRSFSKAWEGWTGLLVGLLAFGLMGLLHNAWTGFAVASESIFFTLAWLSLGIGAALGLYGVIDWLVGEPLPAKQQRLHTEI